MKRLAWAVLAIAAMAGGAHAEKAWTPPRTAEGKPALSGVWSNASVTLLNRPPGVAKLVLSETEAKAMAARSPMVRAVAEDAKPSDVNDDLLADGNTGAGYNAYWMDPGQTLGRVRGEYRTSWIVEPAEGRLPLSEAGRAAAQARTAAGAAVPIGPESLAPWDRCLIASRGSGGPGMLNNIYNSHYQIVQTPDSIVIVVEMVHDARAIPILPTKAFAQAQHGATPRWLGDSTAWWEGDVLVIETLAVHPEQGRAGPIFLSPTGRVTERLSRASDQQLLYSFEVDDPVYYTRSWRAEMSLNAISGQVYEYACHEGNYAISGILGGARSLEHPGGR